VSGGSGNGPRIIHIDSSGRRENANVSNYIPKNRLWIGGYGKEHYFVDAKSAFDAREELRKLTGLFTYDSVWIEACDREPVDVITVVDYVGSAMNGTLEKIVTQVKL
jgi:hypothetical protein